MAAEAAAWALRPREIVDPAPVATSEVVDEAQIDRATAYRDGQRRLFVAGIAVQGGVLTVLAIWPPSGVRRALGTVGRRPVLGAAGVGATLAIGLGIVVLPLDAVAHERAVDAGLSTQSISAWLTDRAKSAAITGVLAAGGAALLVAAMRRFPRRWWIAAAGGVIAVEVLVVWLAPVVLAPVFNRFEPLPEGPTRTAVLELARKADVDVGEVFEVDASRRSTTLNAYVDGLGPTKRVVLFDNLLERADPAEVRSVVAHELAHQQGRDLARGMLFVALVAPLGMLLVQRGTEAIGRRTGAASRTPASLPPVALMLAVTAFGVGIVGNQLSRAVEARADTVALELTDDPDALIDLQRRLAVENLSDPEPPAAVRFLFGTHPPTVERVGAARAWQEGRRP